MCMKKLSKRIHVVKTDSQLKKSFEFQSPQIWWRRNEAGSNKKLQMDKLLIKPVLESFIANVSVKVQNDKTLTRNNYIHQHNKVNV